MDINCPNVNLPEFDDLRKHLGDEEAHLAFFRHQDEGNKDIPTPEAARDKLGIKQSRGRPKEGEWDHGQTKIEPTNDMAKRAQDAYYKNEKDVQEHFKKPMTEMIAEFKRKMVDIGASWKDALNKYHPADAWNVIKMHNLMRGASASADLRIAEAKKDLLQNFNPQDYDAFAQWIQNHRVVETSDIMAKRGEEYRHTQGMTKDEAQAWIDDFKVQHPRLAVMFKGMADKYNNYISVEPLNRLVEEGLMTSSLRDHLLQEHQHYSPTKFIDYIDPSAPGMDKSSGKNLASVHDSGIKALDKGSTSAVINNPLVLMSEVQARTESRIAKNRAARALIDFTEGTPDNQLGIKKATATGTDQYGRLQYGEAPAGYTKIEAFSKDGTRKAVFMPNKLAKDWVAFDPEISHLAATILDWVTGSKILKATATGYNPAFVVSNIPMDIMHAWGATKEYNAFLPVALAQLASDIKDVLPQFNKKSREYVLEGGGMDLLSTQGQFKIPGATMVGEGFNTLKAVEAVAGFTSKYSETLIRLAHRERVLKTLKKDVESGKMTQEEANVEATARARDRIDYAQGGSLSKAADHVIPFFGAAIQGTRGIIKQFAVPETRSEAYFKAAQIVTLGLITSYFGNKLAKKTMDAISDQVKAANFVVPFWAPGPVKDDKGNDRQFYYTIKKDQGQAVFACLGDLIGEYAATGEMPSTDRLGYVLSNVTPADMDFLVKIPMVNVFLALNNTKFTPSGTKPIWTGREVSPSMEVKADTPPSLEKIGQMTKGLPEPLQISPARTKEALNAIVPSTNPFGIAMGAVIEQIFNAMPESKDKDLFAKTYQEQLAQTPLVNRFLRETNPQPEFKEMLTKKAERLGMKVDPDAQSTSKLEQKIHEAAVKKNDVIQQKQIDLDKLAKQAEGGDKEAKKNLTNSLDELYDTDPEEYKTILNHLKKKYPKQVIDLTIVGKIKSPKTYEDLKEVKKWYDEAKPDDVSTVMQKLGGKSKPLVKRLKDFSNPPAWFSGKVKVLISDLKKGNINQAKYESEFKKLMDQLDEARSEA
jgi:hypothetical protein